MPVRDMLVTLVGEPSTAAIAAIDKCVAVAQSIGARIGAVAAEVEIPVRPQVAIPDDPDAATAEPIRFVSNVRGLLQAFDAAAIRLGVRNDQQLKQLNVNEVARSFAMAARLKDITVIPVLPHDDRSEEIVERLVLKSGRPVLMCPEEIAPKLRVPFDNVVIAWDHTAPAARAVADALPWLKVAADVRIITATDKNLPAELESGKALVSHLAEHGIKASFETIKIDGSSVGKVFEAHVEANATDLLVMGAYHHSRLNEILWGGATKAIIGRPPCWVLMSR